MIVNEQLTELQIEHLYPHLGHILKETFDAWLNNELENYSTQAYESVLDAINKLAEVEVLDD